jgi:hypothetical protein
MSDRAAFGVIWLAAFTLGFIFGLRHTLGHLGDPATQNQVVDITVPKSPPGPAATLADEIRAGLDIRAICLECQHSSVLLRGTRSTPRA